MPPPLRSPAERLLIELCRREPALEAIPVPTDSRRTFAEFAALAVRHSVQGLVFGRLARAGDRSPLGAPPAELAPALSLARRQATFWDVEQDRVLGALDRAGFRPLVLKGGALRRGWFSPTERAMGDLDFLVEPHEVTAVLDVLGRLGYRSEYPERAREEFRDHHHHERVAHPGGFLVEVHWRITRPGDLIQLDSDAFQARAVSMHPETGPPVRVPSPEDMLVHTVSQCEQDGIRRLRRLIDVDRIVAGAGTLDWDYIRGRILDAGLHGAFCVTMRLTQLLLGTPLPADVAAGEGLSAATRDAIAALRPVRRILDEPGRGEIVEFHLFRLWCARPDHRSLWLRGRVSGQGDPLNWVWKGGEDPEEGEAEGTTGVPFVLKLLAYQSILLAPMFRGALRQALGREPDFWAPSP